MKDKLKLIIFCLWFYCIASVPWIDKGPGYKIGGINSGNEILEGDLVALIRTVFASLSGRVDNLQQTLEKVEQRAQNISDRLNHVDCYDIKVNNPLAQSDVYSLFLDHIGKRPVKVYCDMTTTGGGWTVIQQRLHRDDENSTVHPTSFDRGMHEYKLGFGEPHRDYWVGLENIFLWTNSRQYELRVELGDFKERKAHALYNFYIDSEERGYAIHVTGYRGTAGDALSTSGGFDNFTADGMMFTTIDQDLDTSVEINCAKFWKIGGWWYNRCSWANLNGPYKPEEEKDDCTGINWHKWLNRECLRTARMMIRPRRT